MFPLLGVLLALHADRAPAREAELPTFSVRAEARAAAAESELRPAALLEVGRDLGAAPASPQWPASPTAPGAAPIFRTHRPEEWVAIAASQLRIGDRGIGRAAVHAAAWVLAMPVRVDVSRDRVYVTVRVRAF